MDRARTAIVPVRDDRLLDAVPGDIESADPIDENASAQRDAGGQDVVRGRDPVDGDDWGEP